MARAGTVGSRKPKYYTRYPERAVNLRAIGFSSYEDYLASELWAEIKRKVLAINPSCVKCHKARKARQVHHIEYSVEVLKGEKLSSLFPVCGWCHLKLEMKCSGPRSGFLRDRATVKLRTVKAYRKHCWKALVGPRKSNGGFFSDPSEDGRFMRDSYEA